MADLDLSQSDQNRRLDNGTFPDLNTSSKASNVVVSKVADDPIARLNGLLRTNLMDGKVREFKGIGSILNSEYKDPKDENTNNDDSLSMRPWLGGSFRIIGSMLAGTATTVVGGSVTAACAMKLAEVTGSRTLAIATVSYVPWLSACVGLMVGMFAYKKIMQHFRAKVYDEIGGRVELAKQHVQTPEETFETIVSIRDFVANKVMPRAVENGDFKALDDIIKATSRLNEMPPKFRDAIKGLNISNELKVVLSEGVGVGTTRTKWADLLFGELDYGIPKSERDLRLKLRKEFFENIKRDDAGVLLGILEWDKKADIVYKKFVNNKETRFKKALRSLMLKGGFPSKSTLMERAKNFKGLHDALDAKLNEHESEDVYFKNSIHEMTDGIEFDTLGDLIDAKLKSDNRFLESYKSLSSRRNGAELKCLVDEAIKSDEAWCRKNIAQASGSTEDGKKWESDPHNTDIYAPVRHFPRLAALLCSAPPAFKKLLSFVNITPNGFSFGRLKYSASFNPTVWHMRELSLGHQLTLFCEGLNRIYDRMEVWATEARITKESIVNTITKDLKELQLENGKATLGNTEITVPAIHNLIVNKYHNLSAWAEDFVDKVNSKYLYGIVAFSFVGMIAQPFVLGSTGLWNSSWLGTPIREVTRLIFGLLP